MQITHVEVIRQTVKLHKVFKISFATVSQVETLIVKVETDAGVTGYGECNPFEPVTGESIATETVALTAFAAALKGADPTCIEHVHEVMDTVMLGHTAAKAGLDMACYDILGKVAGLPVYKLLGGTSNTLTSDVTIGIESPDVMAADAKAWVAKGFRELKIKCGIDDAHDLAAIRAIRKAVGPDIDLRIDANQAWTPKRAARMMTALGDSVSAVEQPLPAGDLAAMPALRPLIAQEVMLDESVHDARDAMRAVTIGATDIINIKLQKSAGLYGAQQINAVAEAAGVACMLGCMVETRLGLTAAAHFVAAHHNVRYADLDAFLDFEELPEISGGFTNDGGVYTLLDKPGLGVDCTL